MLKSLFSGVSGLKSHQTMLDVISNNIANVNTYGYKSSSVQFADIYYQTISGATASSPGVGGSNAMQIGSGTSVAAVKVNASRSSYSQTYNSMDQYISGEGYFIVGDGKTYSRVGSLSFDPSGNLTDANGNCVYGSANAALPAPPIGAVVPITVTNFNNYTSISISENGTITGVDTTDNSVDTLGQIALATFTNPAGLTQEGSVYFKESANSGAAQLAAPASAKTGKLVSGGLEMSNVDLSTELTNMIIAQRGFQASSKSITTSDEILQELVNLKR